MAESITLGPGEVVVDRPFTRVEHNAGDAANLERARGALIDALRRFSPAECACEHTLEFVEQDGRAVRLIIVRPQALLDAGALFVVGFCGQKRQQLGERDLAEMAAVDAELVAQLREHPLMLCYCSIEDRDGDWHNLVLMSSSEAVGGWREGARHQWAVESLTPRYYRSIRLHNGALPRGLASPRIALTSTKYYDFGGDTPWRAVRVLEPGG